jgi:hypothetical protein
VNVRGLLKQRGGGIIDGRRPGTARPLPRWRLPSGPESPPIDPIFESGIVPKARIAAPLTFQPICQFRPHFGFQTMRFVIAQQCDQFATDRAVSCLSGRGTGRCIAASGSWSSDVLGSTRCAKVLSIDEVSRPELPEPRNFFGSFFLNNVSLFSDNSNHQDKTRWPLHGGREPLARLKRAGSWEPSGEWLRIIFLDTRAPPR